MNLRGFFARSPAITVVGRAFVLLSVVRIDSKYRKFFSPRRIDGACIAARKDGGFGGDLGDFELDFLQLSGKRYLIFGVANKKSVAFFVAKMLREEGAECVFVVQNDAILEKASKLFPGAAFFTCDVEKEEEIVQLRREIGDRYQSFDGL